jgi:hypothetical protein
MEDHEQEDTDGGGAAEITVARGYCSPRLLYRWRHCSSD